MQHLRSRFEGQLSASTDSDGNVVIGETRFTPVSILESDNEAYESEFNGWLNGQWVPEKMDRQSDILALHGNRNRYEDLCSAMSRDQVCPFIGSGMSAPSGLPTWSDFLRSIRRYARTTAEDLDSLLAESKFEEAVDCLKSSMPDRLFDERIEHNLRVNDRRSIAGAVQHLPAIFPRLALTTNLDGILESVYADQERQFSQVLIGDCIAKFRSLSGNETSFLLKLHGDSRDSDGRVLGSAEYDRAYADGSALSEEIRSILKTKSVLFLGCSLGADRTVRLIADAAARDRNMPKHYALLKDPGEENPRLEREHFLTQRDIFPIWYRGDHDEDIEALLVGVMKHLNLL
jgi:hypothetical protein